MFWLLLGAIRRWADAPRAVRVAEDPDGLGYFIASHPFVEDVRPLSAVADTLAVPDTVPEWLTT